MAQVKDEILPVEGTNRSSEQAENIASLPRFRRYIMGIARIAQTWIMGILIGLVALGFDLYRLGNPGIWFDEAWSVELSRLPFPLFWHIIWGPEPNMELYYLFLHGWLGFTGMLGLNPTEFVVRLPSAVFAALSAIMVFQLGKRYINPTAGIVGAVLYLLNDLQLVYAQQTRSYSMQVLLICIAWYALFAVMTTDTKQKRWWVGFVIAVTLANYAQIFSTLIFLAQIVAVACLLILPGPWRTRLHRQWRSMLVSLVSIVLLNVPIAIVSRHGSRTGGWIPIPHLTDIYHLFLTFGDNSKLYLLIIAAFCAFGVLIVTLALLPKGINMIEQLLIVGIGGQPTDKNPSTLQNIFPIALSLVCWLIVPIAASYVISQGSTRLFSSRYLVTVVPPLFLLVGLGLALLRWRWVKVGLALCLFLLALYYVPIYYRSAQVEDWNSTSRWLQLHYQTNDGLVCFDNVQGCQISMEYYFHAYPGAAHFDADSPGAHSWVKFGPVNPVTGYYAAVDPHQLAIYGAKHPRIFFIVGRLSSQTTVDMAKHAQQWLDSHYHFIAQIVTRTVTIRLYATGS